MSSTVEKVLILPLIMIVFIALTMIFLNHLSPYIYYTKISDVARMHITSIEQSGGLTGAEKENLLSELESRGVDRNRVYIACIPSLDTPVSYGNPVSITITYHYEMDEIGASNEGAFISLSGNKKTVPIVIGKTGISSFIQ
jgi:hypothetical protein